MNEMNFRWDEQLLLKGFFYQSRTNCCADREPFTYLYSLVALPDLANILHERIHYFRSKKVLDTHSISGVEQDDSSGTLPTFHQIKCFVRFMK